MRSSRRKRGWRHERDRDRRRQGDPLASTSTASPTPTRPRTTSSSPAAGSRTSSSRRSPSTRTSPTGCASSGTSASTTSSRARSRPGAATSPRSTSRTSTTTSSRPRSRRRRWEDLPADILDTWDKLGIPEAEKKYLAGVGAQYESEVVYHKLQADLEGRACIFLDMDSAPARARGHRQAVLRDDHPAERQQVRGAELGRLVGRLVHLRAAGRPDRAAAPGLLPDQRREHGPVRAHADHRRRGRLRALRRGLHRADLLVRLAALARSSRSSSSRAAAAATRRSRTGRTTSSTSSPSAPSPTRTRRWSGSTATSARS